jgi:hypothetical protein
LRRFNSVNFSALNHYFSELSKVITKERYPPDAIFNVDETGFSLGSTQDTVVLIDKAYKTKGKRQPGKQEWIIAIECISAIGVTLLPTIIFKGQNLNSVWTPASTPLD